MSNVKTYPQAVELNKLIAAADRILIMQADNPDGDSLGSALALEQIIDKLGKQPILYCAIDIPAYLHYFKGWDRVHNEIPKQFDLSIIVDVSSDSLFEILNKTDSRNWVAAKPVVIIDHHDVEMTIPFANVIINYPVVATAQVIYELAKQLDWPLNITAKNSLTSAIMSDSLGLTTEATSARSIAIIAEMVDDGVDLAKLESDRRAMSTKSVEITHYKGELLKRIEYYDDDKISIVLIPWEEIQLYSNSYNPSVLVLDDMRQTTGCRVAIAFKQYNDGRITGKIRANFGFPIANLLAQHFGGGGHKYASGFRITSGKSYSEIKDELLKVAARLIAEIENKK